MISLGRFGAIGAQEQVVEQRQPTESERGSHLEGGVLSRLGNAAASTALSLVGRIIGVSSTHHEPETAVNQQLNPQAQAGLAAEAEAVEAEDGFEAYFGFSRSLRTDALASRGFLPDDSWLRVTNYLPSYMRPQNQYAREALDMAVPGIVSGFIAHPAAIAVVGTAAAADLLLGDEIEEGEINLRRTPLTPEQRRQAENMEDILNDLRAIGEQFRFSYYLPDSIRPNPGPIRDALDLAAPFAFSAYMAFLANEESEGALSRMGMDVSDYMRQTFQRLQGTYQQGPESRMIFEEACANYTSMTRDECIRNFVQCEHQGDEYAIGRVCDSLEEGRRLYAQGDLEGARRAESQVMRQHRLRFNKDQ